MRGSSKMHLNRLWRGIGQLEKGKGALNKAQARKVVALVRPWSNKPTMSDNEATNLTVQLSNVLTVAQKNQLKSMAEQRRSRMGDGNRRPGGPRANWPRGEGQGGDRRNGEGRGGPRGGGFDPQRMRQMMGFFRTMNPFYAPTGYKEYKSMPERMQKGMLRRYQTSRAILVGLSKKAG
jgi:hypothetical protein